MIRFSIPRQKPSIANSCRRYIKYIFIFYIWYEGCKTERPAAPAVGISFDGRRIGPFGCPCPDRILSPCCRIAGFDHTVGCGCVSVIRRPAQRISEMIRNRPYRLSVLPPRTTGNYNTSIVRHFRSGPTDSAVRAPRSRRTTFVSMLSPQTRLCGLPRPIQGTRRRDVRPSTRPAAGGQNHQLFHMNIRVFVYTTENRC